ncbi:MAG: 1-deoxy-D-xylulose-5-phosphate reductoisomerase [Oscillospiraceae bacterium]|jgi:1-deoxy-D-xylulose-5-phosphate reductoisomerase|nr:1-deoxy-D-xylulose-5-phosphate reductoisomerase [Oscillospiraceae bacterium]
MWGGVSILGSTGSIGTQTLDVARALDIRVAALAADSNVSLLEAQAREFRVPLAAVRDGRAAGELAQRLRDTHTRVVSGDDGVRQAAVAPGTAVTVVAVVGAAGILPTLDALEAGRRVALANKETLVCAGDLVMESARAHGAEILPVDSEHSAIFQCLQGRPRAGAERLILTASGGPFRGMDAAALKSVTPEMALRHPNWSMGRKVTIDSATMMNKGLEVIEAMHLFSMPLERIKVLVHPQSVVHSMVEYADGAAIAQLGAADMRIPIQYALTYPERVPSPSAPLDLTAAGALTFEVPDEEAFPSLGLAFRAARLGGTAGAVLSGANDAAVRLFLEKKISFDMIPALVGAALDNSAIEQNPSVRDIISAVDKASGFVERMCS